MTGYLQDLTLRLAQAIADLPVTVRERHTTYLQMARRADGGYGGREGESDLYYTGFALRSLAMLGELYGPPAEHSAAFLKQRLTGHESVIDLLSLIYGATLLNAAAGIDVWAESAPNWQDAVAETLESLRRDDGGYAKTRAGGASSTYHSFLVLLCRQLIERPLPDPERLIGFLGSQRHAEGGFREIRVSRRAGTNPTAAAIGALRILDAVDEDVRQETIQFLAGMQTDEGGLRANTRIPIADLLSTFTGVLTLLDLGGLPAINARAALRYAESLQQPEGGFHAAMWDQETDVEYTFYGIGCLGLLRE
ncbi:MAG: terpene cyclase/mutase family protein [Planctomycetota bacterium]|nr:terpene cyclase/mutase family protein [Planctomycetota bacterium]